MRTLALISAAALFLSGCGYKLGEIRPTPMRSVRTLAVPTFKNKTYEPRVEVLLADTLVKTLQLDGTYQIIEDDRADAILYCTLTKVERRSLRSVQDNVLATAEFGLTIEATYQVQDRVTGAILLEGREQGRTTFFSGNDLQTIERQAISNAAADLANQISVAVTEGW
ncbi:MAG: LPS assembly lipoprotein LptE [Terrimicrobiaceae bacterium]|nr:LPS assembly lipoprotein LptE [Terrimicrobiaceae bacterium]